MNAPFVLDASLALNWCFEDEVTSDTKRVMGLLESGHAVAPSFFALELQNGLWVGELRRRISPQESSQIWRRLCVFDIRLEMQTKLIEKPTLVDLARSSGLAVYDAAYLDLAQRTHLPLATLDDKMRRAAMAAGVALLP